MEINATRVRGITVVKAVLKYCFYSYTLICLIFGTFVLIGIFTVFTEEPCPSEKWVQIDDHCFLD